jgi:hypothetical protein
VDEIASGSANLWTGALGCRSFFHAAAGDGRIAPMHFRLPSIDPGVMAFVWALLLTLYIYFGLLAIGASSAFAIVIALVSFGAIWLFVRLRGEDGPAV